MLFIQKLLKPLILLATLCLVGLPAQASASFSITILSVDPLAQNYTVGDSLEVDVLIQGLEYEDVGAFDLNINYDDSILSFTGYTLGDELGDIGLGEAEDWSDGETSSGTINIGELSWLNDLSFQSDEFSLVTLSFTGIAEGLAELSVGYFDIGDAIGDPLNILATIPGYVQVNSVPVPAAAWLLGSGLIGLVGMRRRQIK